VIFLDDDQDLRDVVSELLPGLGVRVTTVASVGELESALTAAGAAFDLAILDINLGPNVPNGLDAFRWLKEHRFAGRIAFLTGHARSHPLVAEAARLGDVAVLDKPINMAELLQVVRSSAS
jgi:CheY-like chemotaxis protein